MKKILMVPALAALVAIAACSKHEETNTVNEVSVNETVTENGTALDTNAADVNTAAVDAATTNVVEAANATDNASNAN